MPSDPHRPAPPVVFKNDTIIIFRALIAVWIAMLLWLTHSVTARTPDTDALVVAFWAIFWLVSLCFTALALWAPRVRVEVSDDGTLVREMALVWRRARRFAAKDLSVSAVEEEVGEGGGGNYSFELVLPGGESFTLGQSRSRPKAAAERARLVAALMAAERNQRSPRA